jgi:hypothetical protein
MTLACDAQSSYRISCTREFHGFTGTNSCSGHAWGEFVPSYILFLLFTSLLIDQLDQSHILRQQLGHDVVTGEVYFR